MTIARERVANAVRHALGIGLAGVGFLTLVWQPIAAARSVARAELAQVRPPALSPAIGDPAVAISAGAARSRLTIRSIGRHGAGTRVVIDDADFDRALDWLARLDRDGLRVSAIAMDRGAQPGRVRVDVTFGRS